MDVWIELLNNYAAEELIKDDLKEHLGRVAFRDMSEATECLEAVKATDSTSQEKAQQKGWFSQLFNRKD